MTRLSLSIIRRDGGTQPRAAIDAAVVAEYAEAIERGDKFPPLTVYFDGATYWLADGFHRAGAFDRLKIIEVEADVRQGSHRDAVLFSVGANAVHGLRRKPDDIERALKVLFNDPEWSGWSDRQIANAAKVGHATVSRYRPHLSHETDDTKDSPIQSNGQDGERLVSRGGVTYTQNTAGIAEAAKARAAERQAEKPKPAPRPPGPMPKRYDPDAERLIYDDEPPAPAPERPVFAPRMPPRENPAPEIVRPEKVVPIRQAEAFDYETFESAIGDALDSWAKECPLNKRDDLACYLHAFANSISSKRTATC